MDTTTVQIFDGPGQPLRREAWPIPEALQDGEVLVGIALATICGSDLHTVSGQRTEPTPAILGHEAVGRVLRKGRGRPELAEGTRVTWSIADSCGRCPACTEFGLPQKCDALFKYGHAAVTNGSGLNGCYAGHILLRAGTHIVPVPDNVSDPMAAPINCALATMVNALSYVPAPCRTAVIQGAGMLGLYGAALLRDRGADAVFCVDVQEGRLELAESFGATPIDGRPGRYEQARARIEQAAPRGVDAVIEVAGKADLVPEGVRLLRPGGHYAFIGMVHPNSALPLTGEAVIRKCLTIHGTHNYGPEHLDEAVAFLARTVDAYPYESLVSAPYRLDEIESALDAARSQQWARVAVAP
ncbi:MAG: zinc-binding dehydrogenase [Candidatus Hydrogenedentes bacterium]|nr:zinc-binding dehydrogenase [Candidatus Hydrogenedentota bacterium]